MASTLALVAAACFALAAVLQQKGAVDLGDVSFAHPTSLLRLAGNRVWLLAMWGAISISLAREGRSERAEPAPALPAA